MNPNRLRWGAIAWLLTLQFFVLETIAQLRFEGAYSRTDDVISALGASDSAARQLMNASFVVQAALILGGVLLLGPALQRGSGPAARVLLGAAALGVLLVGVFPMDGNSTLHSIGAVLYLVGGGLGLIALAYAVRPRSEALGTTLALLGLIATSATVFFLTGVTAALGPGGTERAAAYPLPIGLALAGVALWRLGGMAGDSGRSSRPEERDGFRVEGDAEDQALAASVGRRPDPAREPAVDGPATDGVARDGLATDGVATGDIDTDDIDTEDPWAGSRGRRD